jgi:aryl sulfotransferase
VPEIPTRYVSSDEDSARWIGFPFRDGDIVISTRSKTGTTWVQMICALLIFQTPDLPASLGRLSPWLDFLTPPRDEVYALLAAQQHRRFMKTHTPLDGVPLDARATYIVTARHPLDMAVSLYHQADNIDRERMRQLTGQPAPVSHPRPSVREWLLAWIDADAEPRTEMDSLPGVMWHLSDAWARRAAANVVLIHYDRLSADLEGEMRRLAGILKIVVPEQRWPVLVQAGTFQQMRAASDQIAPGGGVLKSSAAFFRRGRSGAGRELLTDEEVARYHARTQVMAPQDLLGWLHAVEFGELPSPTP